MIRVLIAEDEPPILRALCGLVERTDPTFQIVCSAGDGEEAMRLLEWNEIDVVFTDIRMPVMDGLTLMTHIRERYPDIFVTVLSGYQDFEYLSHAVRTQAFDYLLKPVNQDALKSLLPRIREAHTQRKREQLQATLSARIRRVAEKGLPRVELPERLGVMLLCAGSMPYTQDTELCPGTSYWETIPLDELVLETLRPYTEFSWAFMGNTPVERVVLFEPGGCGSVKELAEYLHEQLLKQATLPIQCACMDELISVQEVGGTLTKLREALLHQVQIGRSSFFCTSDALETGSMPMEFIESDPSALLDLMAKHQCTQSEMRMALRKLTQNLEMRAAIDDSISNALTLVELKADMEALFSRGPNTRKSDKSKRVAEIVAYLHTNYAQRISTQLLSEVFNYVPSYLSHIFRREMDVSPAQYLTQIRIDEAKRIMREQPDRMMKEVAALVGFVNQYHFSKVFKRSTGIWPSNYRRQE